MIKLLSVNQEYIQFVNQLKNHIKNSQIKAALSVNSELIQLYWHIGKQIIEKQTKWGSKLIESLSLDLHNSFPGQKGFSVRNLKYMRQFANSYPDPAIRQQAVAQLPWGHISAIAHDLLKNPYNFDFLALGDDAHEKELTQHVTKFLLELGKGFAYVGTQVPITVNGNDFYIDMLFYHLQLRSYVVIELKGREFKPIDTVN